MERSERERLMDMACHILMRGAKHLLLPVHELEYDTDESGRIEWVHIIYADRHVEHVDVTGRDVLKAFDLIWEKIRRRERLLDQE